MIRRLVTLVWGDRVETDHPDEGDGRIGVFFFGVVFCVVGWSTAILILPSR